MLAWGSRQRRRPPKLQDKRAVHIYRELRAMMLDMTHAAAEQIKTKTVGRDVDQAQQPGAQLGPLRRFDLALENGKLHPNAVVLASACDASQPPAPVRRDGADIVGHEHQHCATAR
jgi:hypothetical protein